LLGSIPEAAGTQSERQKLGIAEFRVALKRCSIGFVLTRFGEGNQLSLRVTPDVWGEIAERRRAFGFLIR
jgi:hypothetical protein